MRDKKRREEQTRESQKKDDAVGEEVGNLRNTVFFQCFVASRFAKAAGAEPGRQIRDEELHAVVARSIFGSQNVQNISGPEHFWKLRC